VFVGADASAFSPWTAAFVARLGELGWIEGKTIAIEYRWSQGRTERYAEIAAEFVRLKVDVIVTVVTVADRCLVDIAKIARKDLGAEPPRSFWSGGRS
jgi:hypothetical protein